MISIYIFICLGAWGPGIYSEGKETLKLANNMCKAWYKAWDYDSSKDNILREVPDTLMETYYLLEI